MKVTSWAVVLRNESVYVQAFEKLRAFLLQESKRKTRSTFSAFQLSNRPWFKSLWHL